MAKDIIEVKIDSKALRDALKRVPERLGREVRFAFNGHGAYFVRQMDRRFGATLQDGKNPTKNRLSSPTGKLRRSIGFRVNGAGQVSSVKMRGHVGNAATAKYVFTQEHGATIHGSPWLTIPLPANRTKAGRVRFPSARALMGEGSDVKTFIRKTKSGGLVIFRSFADGREPVPLWVLKRSVTIPPRLGFVKTFRSKKVAADRIKRINNAVAASLAPINKGGTA